MQTNISEALAARMGEILAMGPVVPVITVSAIEDAAPLAKALVAGGLSVLEVTLRTDCAMQAIEAMAKVEGAVVGVGTIINAAQLVEAKAAGAEFAVSPGATDTLIEAAMAVEMPFLPGVATPGEAMRLNEKGLQYLKLFPAEAVGGRTLLKSIGAPLPHLKFCPTGGISPESAPEYLKLNNVVCVGGSWMIPNNMIANREWEGISALAREAAALK